MLTKTCFVVIFISAGWTRKLEQVRSLFGGESEEWGEELCEGVQAAYWDRQKIVLPENPFYNATHLLPTRQELYQFPIDLNILQTDPTTQNLPEEVRGKEFIAEFSGFLDVQDDGTYEFYLDAPHGAVLYVSQIADSVSSPLFPVVSLRPFGFSKYQLGSGATSVFLSKGLHRFVLLQQSLNGKPGVSLSWAKYTGDNMFAQQDIPSANFWTECIFEIFPFDILSEQMILQGTLDSTPPPVYENDYIADKNSSSAENFDMYMALAVNTLDDVTNKKIEENYVHDVHVTMVEIEDITAIFNQHVKLLVNVTNDGYDTYDFYEDNTIQLVYEDFLHLLELHFEYFNFVIQMSTSKNRELKITLSFYADLLWYILHRCGSQISNEGFIPWEHLKFDIKEFLTFFKFYFTHIMYTSKDAQYAHDVYDSYDYDINDQYVISPIKGERGDVFNTHAIFSGLSIEDMQEMFDMLVQYHAHSSEGEEHSKNLTKLVQSGVYLVFPKFREYPEFWIILGYFNTDYVNENIVEREDDNASGVSGTYGTYQEAAVNDMYGTYGTYQEAAVNDVYGTYGTYQKAAVNDVYGTYGTYQEAAVNDVYGTYGTYQEAAVNDVYGTYGTYQEAAVNDVYGTYGTYQEAAVNDVYGTYGTYLEAAVYGTYGTHQEAAVNVVYGTYGTYQEAMVNGLYGQYATYVIAEQAKSDVIENSNVNRNDSSQVSYKPVYGSYAVPLYKVSVKEFTGYGTYAVIECTSDCENIYYVKF